MANKFERIPVTQKYLMTRGQALNFPAKYFDMKFSRGDVFGMVIDIPMSSEVLASMVCFINGAANLYFNNGGEYSGAAQKYRNLVQAAHTLVNNTKILVPQGEKVKKYDLPMGRLQNIYMLTTGGVYKVVVDPMNIPDDNPELRTTYILYQRVLNELRQCQLKDEAEMRKQQAGK